MLFHPQFRFLTQVAEAVVVDFRILLNAFEVCTKLRLDYTA